MISKALLDNGPTTHNRDTVADCANDGEIVDSGFVDDGTPKPILRLDVTDQSGLLFEYCG